MQAQPNTRDDHRAPRTRRPTPQNLAELLNQRGLNQEQTAVLARTDPMTISRILRGQVRATPETIVRLAKALGVSAWRMAKLTDAHWQAAGPRSVREGLEQLRRIDIDAIASR